MKDTREVVRMAEPAQDGVRAAAGIADLGAEALRARVAYGEGALVVCDQVVRIYSGEGIEVQALQGLDLLIGKGELVAMVGASGSGKSTLMNILAGLDTPTAGVVRVAGQDLGALGAKERLIYRRQQVGFVWQQTSRNLLPYLTARQNVVTPMRFNGVRRRRRESRAMDLLDVLGVAHCADRVPSRMSGGEQQRTAIATALGNEPKVLLADEPTGELDSQTAQEVFGALQTANTELGATVLVVTHDPAVSHQVQRTVAIRDGRTSSETLRHDAADELGNTVRQAVEYAVLDRAGRVQLPREMTERHQMRDRVRLARSTITSASGRTSRPAAVLPETPVTEPRDTRRAGLALDPAQPMVAVRDLTRTFGHGSVAVHAVRGVTFTIGRGQLVALVGRSGSGKTTLLNMVGGLDTPTSGGVVVGGRDVAAMPARERTMLRRSTISFIFQSFGLIPMLTAAENVGIPLRITGTPRAAREERVQLLLSVVGLDGHAHQRPNELSGGQQQRVAIARALAVAPELLIADEPTGQLDSETGRQIMRLLRTVVVSEGITALVATHDQALHDMADDVLSLEDGQLADR